MSIFKIQPAEVKPVEGTVTPAAGQAVETTEPGTGESTVVAEDENKAFSTEENAAAPVVLKVTGALGTLFTETLNKVLAVESMVMIPMDDEMLKEMEDSSVVPVVIHAQILDADMLQSQDVVEMANQAVDNPEDDYIVAVESGRMTTGAASLLNLRGFKNVQVRYSVYGAVDQVMLKIGELLS